MNPRIPALCALAALFAGCDSSSQLSGPKESAAVEPEAAAVLLPAQVSFNEHIQPILSEYCYHCHGPDSGTREPKDAPLRLDRVEDAFALRDDGRPVIIKGKPEESKLISLIHSADPDMIMPPPKSHKTLKKDEIALIERWIEQGAEYEAHWAFAPVRKPEPPAAGEGWAANPIDRFIAEKLDETGLKPNPPEDPRRFYRRLHLDLTGLPPAPEAVDAFVKGQRRESGGGRRTRRPINCSPPPPAPSISPATGSMRRAMPTPTASTSTTTAPSGPYRDWVIRAFQENMPWDQFTTEQIAGDMLPDRTLDQLVATGFSPLPGHHRRGRSDRRGI